MNDEDRTADLDGTDVNDETPADRSTEGEGVPIPSRIREAVEDVKQRVREEVARGRDVVREYEERYYGSRPDRRQRLEALDEEPEAPPEVFTPYKPKRWIAPEDISDNERKWAALAHASTLLTALIALPTAGAGVLITMFVPLCIYFAFRKRSEFVAFHALQAFTVQLIGTIGFVALLLVGLVVWLTLLIISVLLILVLVGIILVPLVALMLPVFILASLALPLGMVIYGVIATAETWSGHNYRIPYVARWVESQMYGGVFSIL
jgi:uncharacterized Tic20 family protein